MESHEGEPGGYNFCHRVAFLQSGEKDLYLRNSSGDNLVKIELQDPYLLRIKLFTIAIKLSMSYIVVVGEF